MYGPARVIQINNTASSMMLPEGELTDEEKSLVLNDPKFESIYPNPGDGRELVVTTNELSDDSQFEVFDQIGNRIEGYTARHLSEQQRSLQFDIALPAGIYHIVWIEARESHQATWIVSH